MKYKRDKFLSKFRILVKKDFPKFQMTSLQLRRKGIYRLLDEKSRERLYFIKAKRKSLEDCNLDSLLKEDNIMLSKLMRLQLKGDKKVLFVVGDNLHWYSI
jgi:hypothetical protein